MASQYEIRKRKEKERQTPTAYAYDVVRTKNGKYELVKIGYNLDSEYVEFISHVTIADALHIALFKIEKLFTDKLMLGREDK